MIDLSSRVWELRSFIRIFVCGSRAIYKKPQQVANPAGMELSGIW
jgi:hypothetical protein